LHQLWSSFTATTWSMGYVDTLIIFLYFLGRRAVHYTYMQWKKPFSLFAAGFAKMIAC